jgi:hypothetical protein
MEDVAAIVGVKPSWLIDGWIVNHQGERRWHLILDEMFCAHAQPTADYLAKRTYERLPPFEQKIVQKAMQAHPKISLAETLRILNVVPKQ